MVTRNLAEYEGLISAIFPQYSIPFFIDRKKPVDSHPLVTLVLSMMDIFVHNWSYESVFRYLKTGLTGIAREEIDILENYVLANGIRGNQWTREEDWDYRPDSGVLFRRNDGAGAFHNRQSEPYPPECSKAPYGFSKENQGTHPSTGYVQCGL